MDPAGGRPIEVSQGLAENYCLRAFYYNYCILPVNDAVSRGFLENLEQDIDAYGASSDVAKACRAIALASHGTTLRRPALNATGEASYQALLGSLAKTVASTNGETLRGALLTAVLLGLYEVRYQMVAEDGDIRDLT